MDVQTSWYRRLWLDRRIRLVVQGIAGIAALWLSTWLAVPALLRYQLEHGVAQGLGRQVQVGAIDFKPWSLELTIDDLRIGGAAAASTSVSATAPALRVGRLYMDGSWQTFWRLAPVFNAVTVDAPELRLAYRGDGHFDVDDVLARLAGTPGPSDGSVMRFAVSNLQLSGGSLTIEDSVRRMTHHVTGVQLAVPLLSSLEALRNQSQQATLALDLDGQHVEVVADGTPFGEQRVGAAQLKVSGFDLLPYRVYLPQDIPLQLRSARLDADLKLDVAQAPTTDFGVSGRASLHDIQLDLQGGATGSGELLGIDSVDLQIKALRPLAQQVHLERIVVQGPGLSLARDGKGRLNVQALLKATSKTGTAPRAEPAASSGTWHIDVDQFALQGGRLAWSDATTPRPARIQLDDLTLQAQSLAWPVTEPVAFDASGRVGQARLVVQGRASDREAQCDATLSRVPLQLAETYLAAWIKPRLAGSLDAQAHLQWQAGDKSAAKLTVQLPRVVVDALALTDARNRALARVSRLELADLAIDPDARLVRLGSAKLTRPSTRVTRSNAGRWMVEDWLVQQAAARRPAQAGKPWTLSVSDLRVAGASVAWRDAVPGRPVALDIDGLAVHVKNFALPARKPFALSVDARIRQGRSDPGTVAWRGSARLAPLGLGGNLTASRLPLQVLQPYLADILAVDVRHVDGSFKGTLRYRAVRGGSALQVQGDAHLEDVLVYTPAQEAVPGQELLDLKDLRLGGLDLALEPGSPLQFSLRETVLSDFYARLMLDEQGHFNLQDLIRPSASATPTVEATPAEPSAAAPEPVIRLGPTILQGGRVDFTDHFIQPNYATQLSELAGRLGGFASRNATDGVLQLADVELRGRAEGSATLEILGRINPLARPLALELQGRVRNLELSPLSTYAARYAGYGIEHGKLSVDVDYKVDPDGQLTASNQIVLNQLKFGDAVPGAKNSLPVKLAVALLADRHGVIDINLPISGSLNDPQFRLMPIVFRMIGNLIVKAVTAPFSLLAKLFEGGVDGLSSVVFAPGSAQLDERARADLAKVAQALRERPGLKLTVVPSASLEAERDAFKRLQLQSMLEAEQRRQDGTPAAEKAASPMAGIAPAAYPDLLKAVYRRARFPKPRNWIGMTKDLPVADMESLLLANISATDADMQMLAVQRGVAVRDYLATLKLSMDRLFLGAPIEAKPEPAWQPQAELKLSTD